MLKLQDIETQLNQAKMDKEQQSLIYKICEELSVFYDSELYECDFRISKNILRKKAIFTAKGPKMSIDDINIDEEEDEEKVLNLKILNADTDYIDYKYRNGKNICQITYEKSSYGKTAVVILALILGIVSATILKAWFPQEVVDVVNKDFFGLVKDIFTKLLTFLIAPVIFLSITSSFINLRSQTKMNKVFAFIVVAHICTAIVATVVGFLIADGCEMFINIGNMESNIAYDIPTKAVDLSFSGFIDSLVPPNLVDPISNNSMLQILFIALLTGYCLSNIKDKAPIVIKFIHQASRLFFYMLRLLMKTMPLVIFCSMGYMVLNLDTEHIFSVFKYLSIIYAGLIAVFVLYILFVFFGGGINPINFIKSVPSIVIAPFAFANSS
ncbi:MAG: cation:dicarboxylase symporter family transporter, partial [Enterococcus sp.]|nr:cation:dicarboxylase symporter family transporter [Enterococcus sp.]